MLINQDILKNDEKAVLGLRSLYKSYGYSQYKMSKFEEYDFYARNKNFLISENIITFTDTNGKLMALKPDVTLSIIKNSRISAGEIKKVYYNENVYRVSRGSNSYKEIMQTGLECIGDIDDYCISEVLELAVKSLCEISGDFVLEVSDLSIVSRVIDILGVSSDAKNKLLKAISEKNLHMLCAVCADENADKQILEILKKLITCYGEANSVISEIKSICSDAGLNSLLDKLSNTLSTLQSKNIRIDFSAVNDMNYYNGIVFRGFINGIPSSVLSGGQYDPLIKKMGSKFGAIGFAVYLDLLGELSKEPDEYDVDAVVLYTDESDVILLQNELCSLRESGMSVSAQKQVSKRLKYKRLYKLTNKGVELIENNA